MKKAMTAVVKQMKNGDDFFLTLSDELEYIISPLQKDLIEILLTQGAKSREELVMAVDRARTTIYDNLMRLSKINIVKKFPRPRNDVGRPVIYFKLTEEFKQALKEKENGKRNS